MLKLFNLKIVFYDEYEQLKEDWEKQNKEIDTLTAERNRMQRKIDKLKDQLEFIKKNGRIPNLGELKKYTTRRKKVRK